MGKGDAMSENLDYDNIDQMEEDDEELAAAVAELAFYGRLPGDPKLATRLLAWARREQFKQANWLSDGDPELRDLLLGDG